MFLLTSCGNIQAVGPSTPETSEESGKIYAHTHGNWSHYTGLGCSLGLTPGGWDESLAVIG